jgi:hypothetical protein
MSAVAQCSKRMRGAISANAWYNQLVGSKAPMHSETIPVGKSVEHGLFMGYRPHGTVQ